MIVNINKLINSYELVFLDAIVIRVEVEKLLNTYDFLTLDFSNIKNQKDILTCSFFSTLIVPIYSLFKESVEVINLESYENLNQVLLGTAFYDKNLNSYKEKNKNILMETALFND